MSERRRPTIRDVAHKVGVSVTTVSHVLNEVPHARVAAGTREEILRTAAALGYTPSRIARGLRLRRTMSLALIGDEIATTPYAGRMIQGAQDAAYGRGWSLLLFNTGGSPEAEQRIVQTLGEYQVDGIVYAAMYHRQVSVPRNLVGRPVVLLDCFAGKADPPAVVPDEHGGAAQAMKELIDAGHRRIGLLTVPEPIPAKIGRMRAYRDCLRDVGVPFRKQLVADAANDARGGYRTAMSLLTASDPPTALFCFSDRMAMGAYRAAAELGLAVPRELSIVGFDDQEMIADSLYPGLTTVALPHYDMGRWAVMALIDAADGLAEHRNGQVVLMHCPLVRRESVAPPP